MAQHDERDVEDRERLAAVETQLKGVLGELREVAASVKDLADRMHGQGTRVWPILFGAAGLAVAIMGMLGSGYVRDQTRNEGDIAELQRVDMVRAESTGRGFERMDGLRKDLDALKVRAEQGFDEARDGREALDITLQREMRLLVDTVNAQLVALDVKLQREMEQGAETREAKIESLRELLQTQIIATKALLDAKVATVEAKLRPSSPATP